jgi:hypothetical protein
MGWIKQLFSGEEIAQLRNAAAAAEERALDVLRRCERWRTELRVAADSDELKKLLDQGRAATARDDLGGWREACELFTRTRLAASKACAELAHAQPKAVARLLLSEASEECAGLLDGEERSAKAAEIGAF